MCFKIFFLLTFATTLNAFSLPSNAVQTVYVSPSGKATETCGTQQEPCLSFQDAFAHTTENSVKVLVSSGDYIQRSIVTVGAKTAEFVHADSKYPFYSTRNLNRNEAIFSVSTGSLTVDGFEISVNNGSYASILKLKSTTTFGSASFKHLSVVAGPKKMYYYYVALFIVDGGTIELNDFNTSYISFSSGNIIEIPEKAKISITIKVTDCVLDAVSSSSPSVLVGHSKFAATEVPSVALTVDNCQFIDASSSCNGGVISLQLPSGSSLSVTNTLFTNCSASYRNGGAVYLTAEKTACNYQFTNVSFITNNASYGKDVFISATRLLEVVSASKFDINFTSYKPAGSLYGKDTTTYTTETDLISLFMVPAQTIYLGGLNAVDSFTCGVSAGTDGKVPCATLDVAMSRLSSSTTTTRTLAICTPQSSKKPIEFMSSFTLENFNIVGNTNSTTTSDWGYLCIPASYDGYNYPPFTIKTSSKFENIYLLNELSSTTSSYWKSLFSVEDSNLTLCNMVFASSVKIYMTLVGQSKGYFNATNVVISSLSTSKFIFNLTGVKEATFHHCNLKASLDGSYYSDTTFVYSNSSTVNISKSAFQSTTFNRYYDFTFDNSKVSISDSSFSGAQESSAHSNSVNNMCEFDNYTIYFSRSDTTITNSNFTHFSKGAVGISNGTLKMSNSYFADNIDKEYSVNYPHISHNLYCTRGGSVTVSSLFNSTDCVPTEPLFFNMANCLYGSSCFSNISSTLYVPTLTNVTTNTTDSYYYVYGSGSNLFPCSLEGVLYNTNTDTTSADSKTISNSTSESEFEVYFSRSNWKSNKNRAMYFRLRFPSGSTHADRVTEEVFKLPYIQSKSEKKQKVSQVLSIVIPCSLIGGGIVLAIIIVCLRSNTSSLSDLCSCCPCSTSTRKKYTRKANTDNHEPGAENPNDNVAPYAYASIDGTENPSSYVAPTTEETNDTFTAPSYSVPASYPSVPDQNASTYQSPAYSAPSWPTYSDSDAYQTSAQAYASAPLAATVAPSAPEVGNPPPYSLPRKDE